MRTIDVEIYTTPEQTKAFNWLAERDMLDGLEAVAGVTKAHELTKYKLQLYLDTLVQNERTDSFEHGFDYGFDFGVAMAFLGVIQ